MKTFDEAMKVFEDKTTLEQFAKNMLDASIEHEPNERYQKVVERMCVQLCNDLLAVHPQQWVPLLSLQMHIIFCWGKLVGMDMEKRELNFDGVCDDKKD